MGDGGFVFSSKVQEIQEGIAERKERAILQDKAETKRSEENEFIKELQARSAANKELYAKQSMRADKLSTDQFNGQYKRPSYQGVRTSDGSIKMILSTEVERLKKVGKIKIDYEVKVDRDGNEFQDLSKKILVLIDDNDKEDSSISSGKTDIDESTSIVSTAFNTDEATSGVSTSSSNH